MNVISIGGIQVAIDEVSVQAQAGLAVCADGCPRAYAPIGSLLIGVDYIGNAGRPGHWVGVDVDAAGDPIVQGEFYPNLDGTPSTTLNPTVGYLLSPTAYRAPTTMFYKTDPRRYLDALVRRYLSIPRDLYHRPVDMGDVGTVTYGGVTVSVMVGEEGPEGKLWEASVATHRALGHDPITRPQHLVGLDEGVSVKIFRNTSRGWNRTNEDVDVQVAQLLAAQTAD